VNKTGTLPMAAAARDVVSMSTAIRVALSRAGLVAGAVVQVTAVDVAFDALPLPPTVLRATAAVCGAAYVA